MLLLVIQLDILNLVQIAWPATLVAILVLELPTVLAHLVLKVVT